MPLEYYELQRITIPDPEPGEFRIASAALLTCGLCGTTIDGSGGPGDGPICIPCGNVVRRGQARGAIKWSESADDIKSGDPT
jgi:hypothetical protein